MPSWSSLSFQDSGSISMMELTILHEYVMVVMTSILLLIFYILLMIIISKSLYKTFSESTLIETIWSLAPALILILLVIPSMKVLYMVEDVKNPQISLKVVAHQWYWSYISPLFNNLSYLNKNKNLLNNNEWDSLMVEGSPRLLKLSSSMFIPSHTATRFLITSTDVIHSFAVPSLGLKVDAMPGRINQLYSNPIKVGIYFGQCSEICGSNHSFMSINLLVSSMMQHNEFSLLKTMEKLN